jgi:phenylpropionate dioxygenase-like ring-hydroxylating dioxygenase large terminal subunit
MYAPATHPSHYTAPHVHTQEQQTLFAHTWQFVGFTHALANPQDFLTATIAGKAVVVQRFAEGLRAFLNVCTHRYSALQTTGCGNRPLQCPYHGWTFNADGQPYGIPCQDQFTPRPDPVAMALTPYRVAVCGSLVFVCLSPLKPSLPDYLGQTLFNLLDELTGGMAPPMDVLTQPLQANWKVFIENSLEGYHVPLVHPTSISRFNLGKPLPDCVEAETDPYASKFNFAGPHSWLTDSPDANALSNWAKVSPAFASRVFHTPHYMQIQVFPNLNVATFYGANLFVQRVTPTTATQCTVDHWTLAPVLQGLSPVKQAMVKLIMEENKQLGHTILAEDVGIIETVQQGLNQAGNATLPATSMLCREEQRVWAFQQAYSQFMAPLAFTEASSPYSSAYCHTATGA